MITFLVFMFVAIFYLICEAPWAFLVMAGVGGVYFAIECIKDAIETKQIKERNRKIDELQARYIAYLARHEEVDTITKWQEHFGMEYHKRIWLNRDQNEYNFELKTKLDQLEELERLNATNESH